MGINVGDLTGSLTLEDQLSKVLDEVHARLNLTGIDFDELNKKIVTSADVFKQAAGVQTVLQAELAKTTVATAGLRDTMDKMAEMSLKSAGAAKMMEQPLQEISKEFLVSKSQGDAFRESMKLLDQQFNSLQKTTQITSQQIVSFGRGLQEAGFLATTVFTAPIVAAGAAAIGFATEFEKAMTKASVLGGLTATEMKGFEATVLSIAQTMGKAPAEVAMGLDIIGSAMFKGAEATDILTRSTKMAALGMGTVEETTRAVVGAMLAYKNESLSAAEASDILLKTVQLGNMKIGDLVGALAKINPLAAAMGIKFADVNAAIATFTHLGAPAEVAATGVRAVLSNLLNDAPKTEKGLRGLNIEMSSVLETIRTKGLTEALLGLVEAAEKMPGGMEKLNQVFPNIRALTLVLADAKAQGQTFDDITQKIRASMGELDAAFAQTRETWAQQWNELTVAVQVFAIQIGEELLPDLKMMAGIIKDDIFPVVQYMVDVFKNLPEPVKIAGLAFVGFIAAVGPILIFAGQVIRSFGHIQMLLGGEGLLTALPTLGKAITVFTTGTGLAIAGWTAGIAVAGFAVYELWQVGKNLYAWWDDASTRAATDQANAAGDAIRTAKLLADASDYAKQPITDVATAMNVLYYKAKEMRGEIEFVGPKLQEAGDKAKLSMTNFNLAAALASAATILEKQSIDQLLPGVADLAEQYFKAGNSAAEVYKAFLSVKLITEDQKVAIENLFDAHKAHEKLLKDISKAYEAAAMAMVPLSVAQKEEAEALLKVGLGHQQIADKIHAHIAQVNALVKSKAEQDKAMKEELKAIDKLSDAWDKYYKDLEMAHATDSEKIVIKADADYKKRVDMLEEAGVAEQKYYDDLWKLRDMDIAREKQELLEKDTRTKAYLLNKLDKAKQELMDMLSNQSQYRDADIKAQRESVKGLQDMKDHWNQVGHAIDKNTEKVRTLSGEILTMKEYEARQLSGGAFDVTSQNFAQAIHDFSTAGGMNPFGTISETAALALAKKGYSFAEIIAILSRMNQGSMGPIPPPGGPRIPGFATGGVGDFKQGTLAMLHGKEAIVPLGKGAGAGKIVIEQGAFQFNYPIMNDPRALDQLGQVVDRALSERLANLGFRNS